MAKPVKIATYGQIVTALGDMDIEIGLKDGVLVASGNLEQLKDSHRAAIDAHRHALTHLARLRSTFWTIDKAIAILRYHSKFKGLTRDESLLKIVAQIDDFAGLTGDPDGYADLTDVFAPHAILTLRAMLAELVSGPYPVPKSDPRPRISDGRLYPESQKSSPDERAHEDKTHARSRAAENPTYVRAAAPNDGGRQMTRQQDRAAASLTQQERVAANREAMQGAAAAMDGHTPAGTLPEWALSIQQPWAWAILQLGKDFENRTWATTFRGRVMIHASKKIDQDGVAWLTAQGYTVPNDLPTGAHVGEVTITDCNPVAEVSSMWAFGPYCFRLKEPRAYANPTPGVGRLKFFRPDETPSEGAKAYDPQNPVDEAAYTVPPGRHPGRGAAGFDARGYADAKSRAYGPTDGQAALFETAPREKAGMAR